MDDDDFTFLTEKDRRQDAYLLCVGGTTLIGLATGAALAVPGMLAGAAEGLAVGLLTCRRLSPVIERKLFSRTESLSDRDLLTVLKVVRDAGGVRTKSEAMYLFSQVRTALAAGPDSLSDPGVCLPPKLAAKRLLAYRA
jgi:hypothetical protein